MKEFKSSAYGYVPHAYQTKISCPRCGNDTFQTFAQGMNVSAKIWCHEYVCSKCGHYIGIEVDRE